MNKKIEKAESVIIEQDGTITVSDGSLCQCSRSSGVIIIINHDDDHIYAGASQVCDHVFYLSTLITLLKEKEMPLSGGKGVYGVDLTGDNDE